MVGQGRARVVFRRLWLAFAFVLTRVGAASASADPASHSPDAIQTPPAPDQDDNDADGVSDETERQQETDPDVPGLFPGSYPHIPEPLHFDLVRGLGAQRGEFEFNVLSTTALLPYEGIAWAPEVEWAFADRHAIEFELPMHDGSLEAVKMAVQGTFRELRPKFIHGWQFIAEGILEGAGEFTGLYIAGRRLGRRTSVLAILGPRVAVAAEGVSGELLVNPSIFVDLGERLTLGLENNAVLAGAHSSVRTLPQLHIQLGRHFRAQIGAGVETSAAGLQPVFGLRLVVE